MQIKPRSPWADFSGLCPSCVPQENRPFDFNGCHQCLIGVIEPIVSKVACPICSQVTVSGKCKNQLCNKSFRPFGQIYAIGYRLRGNLLYKLTYNLKFRNRRGNELPLAVLLAGHLRDNSADYLTYDLLVPIPRTKEKAERVGDPLVSIYNRARKFISKIGPAKMLEKMVPVDQVPLKKSEDIGKATDKGLYDRQTYANRVRYGLRKNPYRVVVPKKEIKKKRVLLIDDIFTTGYHTMYLAALAFNKRGADQVDGLVIAREAWRE